MFFQSDMYGAKLQMAGLACPEGVLYQCKILVSGVDILFRQVLLWNICLQRIAAIQPGGIQQVVLANPILDTPTGHDDLNP